LVHADGAVILAASPEQAAEREVQLDRLRVDLDHSMNASIACRAAR